jgi:hypothetical protein
MTAYEETYYELNGIEYLVEVAVEGKLVDESFDHEFGTESAFSAEVESVEIITVYGEYGKVITSRAIIGQLENMVDVEDFEDVEFDLWNL